MQNQRTKGKKRKRKEKRVNKKRRKKKEKARRNERIPIFGSIWSLVSPCPSWPDAPFPNVKTSPRALKRNC